MVLGNEAGMREPTVAIESTSVALVPEARVAERERTAGKLSLGTKVAYGLPGFVGAAMHIPVLVHMPQFYSDTVLVPVGFVALAIAVVRGFDAITDPLMG